MLCYGLSIILLALAGWLNALNWPFYLGLLAASALAIYHYKLIKNRQPEQCFKAFLHNNYFGGVIFLGLLASFYVD
jgi:4-hydroxybenzoate polyprenyltransferase